MSNFSTRNISFSSSFLWRLTFPKDAPVLFYVSAKEKKLIHQFGGGGPQVKDVREVQQC